MLALLYALGIPFVLAFAKPSAVTTAITSIKDVSVFISGGLDIIIGHSAPTTPTTSTASTASTASTTATTATTAIHTIEVAAGGHLQFEPNYIRAEINDTIVFHFLSGNHSLTQSTIDHPCTPLKDGFDTGFVFFDPRNETGMFAFFSVQSTKPRWFFCHQQIPISHCHAGMIFAINPGDGMSRFITNADAQTPRVTVPDISCTIGYNGSTIASTRTLIYTTGSSALIASSGPHFTTGTGSSMLSRSSTATSTGAWRKPTVPSPPTATISTATITSTSDTVIQMIPSLNILLGEVLMAFIFFAI
ncbi:MAG: hypothetical protein M1834_004248 [Cirrosporium novae-zelandiae]|nr:MAG: hypothetical protein M1834_004248 [Cirrosporium novae-zelandiae]